MMFWVDFTTCQQRPLVRSTGNTLWNPLGEAKTAKADALWVWLQRLRLQEMAVGFQPSETHSCEGLAEHAGVFYWEFL